MTLTISNILGPEGRIAQKLPAYESRPQQLEMAQAVSDAVEAKEHLIVEAGTGVGKSFAYLVPAILKAAESRPSKPDRSSKGEESSRRRVVISTHTISLQSVPVFRDEILQLQHVLGKRRSCKSRFSEAGYHLWRSKFGGISVSDASG